MHGRAQRLIDVYYEDAVERNGSMTVEEVRHINNTGQACATCRAFKSSCPCDVGSIGDFTRDKHGPARSIVFGWLNSRSTYGSDRSARKMEGSRVLDSKTPTVANGRHGIHI